MRAAPLAVALAVTLLGGARPARAVDDGPMWDDIRFLAGDDLRGRAVGSDGDRRARDYLETRLRALGVEPLLPDGYQQPFTFVDANSLPDLLHPRRVRGVNVLGIVRGRRDPDRAIVVSAHYDGLGVRGGKIHPGADDNASGVAALLQIASEVARAPAEHSVVFALFDGEEAGLRGAEAFFARPPLPRDHLLFDLNLDMVGRDAGKREIVVCGVHRRPFLKRFVDAARDPAADLHLRLAHDRPLPATEQDWTTASDHFLFHQHGVPFLYLGDDDEQTYHRPTDRPERIVRPFLVEVTRFALRLVRVLDPELEHLRPPAHARAAVPRNR